VSQPGRQRLLHHSFLEIGKPTCGNISLKQGVSPLVAAIRYALTCMDRLRPYLNHGILKNCLIPRFDGLILSKEWKDALWDRFVTGAPRPRTPSEQQYSDRKLRSRS
jgi:hypothetical protein